MKKRVDACINAKGEYKQHALKYNLLSTIQLLFEPDDPWIFQLDGASAHIAHSYFFYDFFFT
ncbi:hypothetical protein BpHYR1_049736 [Brachionus plicatilis]|uniref:Uncharacterized protein n=1 Tax=Brachionus plicatilis TaxID=10195 RepID=A0A3M7QRG0_BRAPC|nr:hypothetical protein BpHYR1_049736 [Brachionus plicatilis]